MSIKDSRAAWILSMEQTTNKDNNSKDISPALNRQAITDGFDTIIASYATVGDITTLNALVLGTDFKENDLRFVTDIGKGDKIGVYKYIRSRATTLYSWQKIAEIGEATKLILSTQSTLSLYISTDWTTGDLAIGYLVKLTGGQVYELVTGTGSSTGNYQVITEVNVSLNYKGTWNASTNTPTLSDSGGGGVQGDYYIVSVSGSTAIDGITDWVAGDWITNNGVVWQKIDNTDAVTSVNAQTGAVVLDIDDVTPTTTKGDLIVENGSNAIRVAVGANDTVLTADSAEESGVKWAAGGGREIQDATVAMATRGALNFTGVTLADNAGNDSTDVDLEFGAEDNVDITGAVEGSVPAYDAAGLDFIMQDQEEFDLKITLQQSNIATPNAQMAVYIPAGYEIDSIFVEETAGNAAGNISIGTAAAGTQIVNAFTVGASADLKMTLVSTGTYFSKTADQDIYISSSAWGTGVLDVTINCSKIW